MAELANSLGVIEITVNLTAVAVVRGTRLARNSSGLYAALASEATRGDAIALADIPASGTGPACLPNTGRVPALFDGAIADGAIAYAGTAAGKFSPTSTGAAIMGRCTLAASGNGVLGQVDLFPVM